MSALRVMLVDDEAPARALMREYLAADPGVSIVAECANGFEAVKAIAEHRPDLVFLDVQMPKLDGFEVLELLDDPPAVVFCTAYDEFALRAFEVHAVDYLLKPFGRERLAEALVRVRERQAAREAGGAAAAADPAKLAADAREPGRLLERIVIRDGAQVHVVPVERIEAIEAQDDYAAIHTRERTWLKHQALATLETQLDPGRFIRVHRSFIVNVECIARLELMAKDNRVALLHGGREVPVSRSGYQRLRERMGG